MRHLASSLASAALAALIAGCAGTPGAPPAVHQSGTLVISHVTVVDVEHGKELADRTIIVDGDRIVDVAQGTAPAGARVVDGHGKWVIPGLWDMHVHFHEATAAGQFIGNGVTGVRVMWGVARSGRGGASHWAMRQDFESGANIGPRMLIASKLMDGPNPVWSSSLSLATPEQGREAVDEAKQMGADFVKVYSRLPRDVFYAIAERAKVDGLPFAGHVPESIRVEEATDAGMLSIEHLTGMIVATSSRELEIRAEARRAMALPEEERGRARRARAAEAIATYDPVKAAALYAKFVKNGTAQCPTLSLAHAFANLDDPGRLRDPRLVYVSPTKLQGWDPTRDFRTRSRVPEDYASFRGDFAAKLKITGDMNKAGVMILAGSDEPNPFTYAGFTLQEELGWLVKAGLTPLESLRAATLNPARFMHREAKLGTVERGKLADLVVLDADPLVDIGNTQKIFAVVTRGVLLDRRALDEMLAAVREADK